MPLNSSATTPPFWMPSRNPARPSAIITASARCLPPGWRGHIGEKGVQGVRVLKDYFDPDYTMNPGGTIGLDLTPEEKRHLNERKDYR